ncbi:MAG: chemotaxis protein CheA [Gammaproteobacteria bacterium]|nr:chemotaxis protein CheA [Gammaproteobacteria bacterium]
MAIDVSQFLQTFYEESFEGLDIMESGLLNLDGGSENSESINDIFRAAHSIKGGSGTFGLNAVASFTHVLESLLDEMRDGRRQITKEGVNLLLESVDCLREMLKASQGGDELDAQRIADVHGRLEAMWGKKEAASPVATASGADNESAASEANSGWDIKFSPFAYILKTGNEPARMFRELGELGELTVTVNTDKVPDFSEMDPDECFLSWDLKLEGNVKRSAIDDVFSWIEEDCDLKITPIASKPDTASQPAAASGPTAAPTSASARSGGATAEAASIRVGIDKVDSVINLVGELVITQSMLSTTGEAYPALQAGLAQLERNTRELQEQVMRMRMLPVSFVFNRFPRLVHDISQKLGKQIELKMSGEQTELDKTVIEKVTDPLVHLIRNSLDHGIEMPEDRRAAGKPATGTVWLDAYHKGGNIIIEVKDDGKGIDKSVVLAKAIERGLVDASVHLEDEQILDLIFQPGFSTAKEVSDLSGRGVGMDVVRRNIQSLGGGVEIRSKEGEGSTITVRLPLTLAILDGQTVEVGTENYIVPLVSIVESTQIKPEMLNYVAGKGETFMLRDEYIPVIRLYEIFDSKPRHTDITKGLLVVVESDGKKIGLFVDDLLGQQQVVIKSLETNYKKVDGISGATILGDGSVALILDIPGLIRLSQQNCNTDRLKMSA